MYKWDQTDAQTVYINVPFIERSFMTKTYPVKNKNNKINTTGVTRGAGNSYPSGAHELTPGF